VKRRSRGERMRAEEAALLRAEREVKVRLPRVPPPRKHHGLSVEEQARWFEEQLERDAGAGIDMPRWARGEKGAAIDDRDFRCTPSTRSIATATRPSC
jgi:hypothetical protein